jgi:radical SAM superfamily enzyme YgiQ (UPF0313 family)
MNTQLDMLVVSVPVLDLQYPPSSPAVIKSCVIAGGFTAKTLDLNVLLLEICGSKDKFSQVQYNFENSGPMLSATSDYIDVFFDNDHDVIREWVNQSVEKILQHNPRWLGISVFSYKSHKATLLLCAEMRKRNINVKIVLGGRGASSYALGPDHAQFKHKMQYCFGEYPSLNFSETLLHYELVDKVIQGDAENAVIDLLANDTEDNVNALVDDIDLEQVPFVDFDDYNLAAYDYVNEPVLPITGSKGCVRKCTFCDIPVLWPKFKWRSGDHIAREMIHLNQKHGVRKFYLSDSLVNGALKSFKDFITTLADHNVKNPDNQLQWIGQYITRKRSKSLNDEYYNLIKLSGGEGLTIGVESGSDAVREHMKKQFSTDDIDHELSEFDKRSISCVLLFFSCYPTETWSDFMDTVYMFMRYQKYCASGTVYKMTLGTPYTHHAQTPLWNMQDAIGLSSAKGSDILWTLRSNPDLHYYERIRRRLILQEVSVALHLPMSRNTPELNQLIDSLKLHEKDIDNYFKNIKPIMVYPNIYNLTPDSQVLMPLSLQHILKSHIDQNPEYKQLIAEKHNYINDDIKFDNEPYLQLRQMLINSTTALEK